MLGRLLESRHAVTLAFSAKEALAHLGGTARFDAVLCDISMPVTSGADLYARVRAEHPTLARRFVFMTGAASAGWIAEFLRSVPNAVLEKPFGLVEVERALHEMAATLG